MAGVSVVLRGQVLQASDCATPRGGAVVDVWQANDAGAYDNEGYTLRARVVCDADGRFEFRTVRPGRYSERPVEHIHFKLWASAAAESALLTSQFYFEDDERYNPEKHLGPVLSLDADGVAECILAV